MLLTNEIRLYYFLVLYALEKAIFYGKCKMFRNIHSNYKAYHKCFGVEMENKQNNWDFNYLHVFFNKEPRC